MDMDSCQLLGTDVEGKCGWDLPLELTLKVLGYLNDPETLCSVAMVSKGLAAASSDDSLWRPLGHPNWQNLAVVQNEGWKRAYMDWLRVAIDQYRRKRMGQQLPSMPNQITPAPGSEYDYVLNFIVMGASRTGRTSMIYSCIGEREPPVRSIGIDFRIYIIRRLDETLKLLLWDEADPRAWGRQRYDLAYQLRRMHGIALIFDITDRSSFEYAIDFLHKVKEAKLTCPMRLVGNKKDLESSRAVSQQEAEEKAQVWELPYSECSTLTGEGVQEIFASLTESVMSGWSKVDGYETPYHVPNEMHLASRYPNMRKRAQSVNSDVGPEPGVWNSIKAATCSLQ